MTFLDLLHSGTSLDCGLIIGGCDMPASFVWDEKFLITDYVLSVLRASCMPSTPAFPMAISKFAVTTISLVKNSAWLLPDILETRSI